MGSIPNLHELTARHAIIRTSIPFLEPELPPLGEVMTDFAFIYASKTYSNGGPFERRFSRALASYLNVRNVVPVANATLGLTLAIKALAKSHPRGKVVLPSFTFIASALAVEWAGFTPVFCDVDEDGWQATATHEQLAALGDELVLLLPCNTFGAPADVDAWARLGQGLGVPVLVDSAPGLGATYLDGRHQGQAGVTEVFSMHATKPFAIGEGGVITTDDDELAAKLTRMRNFGLDERRICQEGGLNAKLTELQAAIALRVLDRIDDIATHRRERAVEYREQLEPLGFSFQRHGEHSAYQFVPARVPRGLELQKLRTWLSSEGIETRDYFTPTLHHHPHLAKTQQLEPLTVTEALEGNLLSLPMSNHLTADGVARVCSAIGEFLRGA